MLVVFIIRFCNKSCSVVSSFLQDSPGIIWLFYALNVWTAKGGGWGCGRYYRITKVLWSVLHVFYTEVLQELHKILFALELIQDYNYFRILLKWHRCLKILYSPTNRHGSPLVTSPPCATYTLLQNPTICHSLTFRVRFRCNIALLDPRTKADTAQTMAIQTIKDGQDSC